LTASVPVRHWEYPLAAFLLLKAFSLPGEAV